MLSQTCICQSKSRNNTQVYPVAAHAATAPATAVAAALAAELATKAANAADVAVATAFPTAAAAFDALAVHSPLLAIVATFAD